MRDLLTCVRQSPGWTVAVASLVALTVWGEHASADDVALLALDVTVGLAGCCLVPLLFRWPVPAALALAALAIVSPAATPPANVGTLQVARRRSLTVAVALAVAGVLAHALRGLWRPVGGLSYGWWLVLVVVAHAALVAWGALAGARKQLIASLRDRAERAEAEQGRRVAEARAAERTRLAREMHDVLAHRLSLLATYAGALEFRPDAPPERLAQAAGVIRSSVHQALDELRDVITLLRDDPSESHPEPDRPLPTLADLPRLVEECKDVGTVVELHDDTLERESLLGPVGRTAYRVLQEALTNVRKHAPGQPVSIRLAGRPGGRLTITVTNPINHRLVPATAVPGSGTGLVGLTERVRLAGGQLDHRLAPAEFRLRAWLPWPA